MNYIDIGFVVATCIAAIVGIKRGLLKQFVELLGIVIVFVGSCWFVPVLQNYLDWDVRLIYLACVGAFGFVYSIISTIMEKMISKTTPTPFNRFLGATFSIMSLYLIGCVLLEGLTILSIELNFNVGFLQNSWVITNIYGDNPVIEWLKTFFTK